MGGNPPEEFPATQDHPYLQFIRPLILYDPAAAIRQIKLPVLALFGELDNNILLRRTAPPGKRPSKPRPRRLHAANPAEGESRALEAKIGNNAEMKSLQRFVPAYSAMVLEWLSKRVNGLGATK
jgi:hypothetical protein